MGAQLRLVGVRLQQQHERQVAGVDQEAFRAAGAQPLEQLRMPAGHRRNDSRQDRLQGKQGRKLPGESGGSGPAGSPRRDNGGTIHDTRCTGDPAGRL